MPFVDLFVHTLVLTLMKFASVDCHLSNAVFLKISVMYLQTNAGGITIFGWTVDRALLNTIFFIELSLITFVLGKTIVFSST